tara:strand:+ start:2249 stop:2932 length:684 start_codon:yes stop_codon:yes gene_type:complete
MAESLTGKAIDPFVATAAKLRAWLRDNGAQHIVDQTTEERTLRVAVVRRQRRIQMVKDPPIRGVTAAWSLTQFKDKLQDMNTKGFGPKDYVCFNAKLVQVDMTVTVLRHNSSCRGVVKHGRCSTCGEETVGESNFAVSFDLQDLEDSRSLYNMIGYKAAGEAIFGKNKSATTVEDMNMEAVADILENWMEVPINVHAIIEYDMNKGKTRVSPYNLARLPIDYLTEYS